MYLISGTYNVYGLKSKSKPDIDFEFGDAVDLYAIDFTEEEAMDKMRTKIIGEFGSFDVKRFEVESHQEIVKEFNIDWNHIDF